MRGLKTGWAAFVNVVMRIVTVVGFLLPFVVALALVGFVSAPLRRSFRRRLAERRKVADPFADLDHEA